MTTFRGGESYRLTVVPPFRDIKGRFATGKKALTAGFREGARDQGLRLVTLARGEAPVATGRFKQSIRFRTFVDRSGKGSAGFSVSSLQPLSTFIRKGTKPHSIRARRARFLRFYWAKLGRVVYFPAVNHPGTDPNDYLSRAHVAWLPGAKSWLRRVSRDYVEHLK